jgi:drug/metabolite transporter (DMT)-like permease
MSLEAVFALIAGMIFLQETITFSQSLGMALILLSIVLVTIPWKKIQVSLQK